MDIKLEQIKQIAHSNQTAECIFLCLDERERPRTVLNLDLFRRYVKKVNPEYDEKAFYKTFEDLQSLGVGSISFGKEGKPTTFKWNYSLKDISRAGLGYSEVSIKNAKLTVKPAKKVKTERKKPTFEYKIEGDKILFAIPFDLIKH